MLALSPQKVATDRDEAFQRQVDVVRESQALGRSHALARLFDYLVEVTRSGSVVQESELAHRVFGRGEIAPWDASVRVSIHRLRRKLEAFYAGPGRDEPGRLTVPLGAYRLALTAQTATAATPRILHRPRASTLVICALTTICLALGVRDWTANAAGRALSAVARAPLWQGLGTSRPILLVVGDDYVFGETDDTRALRRMIRDFDINSPADLDDFLMQHPRLEGRYLDMNTSYTPIGATLALRPLLPLLQRAAGARDRLRVVVSSELTPEMLKGNDLVYVGYLSGLRMLQEPAFEGGRFAVGESFDQLADRRTGKTFSSDAALAPPDLPNHDLGYVASLRRVNGERLVVIAGARDPGVLEMAKVATDPKGVAALMAEGGRVEAAFDVEGMGRTNFTSRRLDAATR